MVRLTQPESSVLRLEAKARKGIAAAYDDMVRRVLQRLPEGRLADRIDGYRLADSIANTVEEVARQTLAVAWVDAYNDAGRRAVQFVEDAMNGRITKAAADDAVGGVTLGYGQMNEPALEEQRRNSLRLIREITEQQREAVRDVLIEGQQNGYGPRKTARQIRQIVGLTAKQRRAVASYRSLLETRDAAALTRGLRDRRTDATVQRAIDNGTSLTQQQIDRMVQRYAERYRKYRSEVIARTEALRAVNLGSRQGMQQLIDRGEIRPDQVIRQWSSAGDARVRDSHSRLNGAEARWNEPFMSDNGAILHPGDPDAPAAETVQCRCTVIVQLDLDDEQVVRPAPEEEPKPKPRKKPRKKPEPKPTAWLDSLPPALDPDDPYSSASAWHAEVFSAPPSAQDALFHRALAKANKELAPNVLSSDFSQYSGLTKTIFIPYSGKVEISGGGASRRKVEYWRAIWAHEYGHHIDRIVGTGSKAHYSQLHLPDATLDAINKAMGRGAGLARNAVPIVDPDEINDLLRRAGLTQQALGDQSWIGDVNSQVERLARAIRYRDPLEAAEFFNQSEIGGGAWVAFSDTIHAVSVGIHGFGHSAEYFSSRPGNRQKEIAANYVAMRNYGNVAMSIYRYFFPDLAQIGDGMIEALASR